MMKKYWLVCTAPDCRKRYRGYATSKYCSATCRTRHWARRHYVPTGWRYPKSKISLQTIAELYYRGATVKQLAEQYKVCEGTIYEWLQEARKE